MTDDIATRASCALRSWLARLSKADQQSIPMPSSEREQDDGRLVVLLDPAPSAQKYREGADISDTMGEYTLRAAGYSIELVRGDRDATEGELLDEHGAGTAQNPALAARKKEERRTPRTRSRIKAGELPDLSALAQLQPANEWAGELATELLRRKLTSGFHESGLPLARIPEPTGPAYISRNVLGWALRTIAPRGGNMKLGPLRLAQVLANPIELASRVDDGIARRHVQKMCPPLVGARLSLTGHA